MITSVVYLRQAPGTKHGLIISPPPPFFFSSFSHTVLIFLTPVVRISEDTKIPWETWKERWSYNFLLSLRFFCRLTFKEDSLRLIKLRFCGKSHLDGFISMHTLKHWLEVVFLEPFYNEKEAMQFYCHYPAKRSSIRAFYWEFTSAALQMSLLAGSWPLAVERRN